jgi:2'-5' RNA ligase
VARALARVDRPGFEVSLEGLDALGSKKPSTVVACVKRSAALKELQAEHERIIQRIGLEPERRKFRPHVTLARLRGAGEPDVAAYLAMRGHFKTAPFPVGRFVLLSSRASKGGGPYVMEEAYPLAA